MAILELRPACRGCGAHWVPREGVNAEVVLCRDCQGTYSLRPSRCVCQHFQRLPSQPDGHNVHHAFCRLVVEQSLEGRSVGKTPAEAFRLFGEPKPGPRVA